ncbi:helix-turn-helix domain-containing protein [Mycolicibacterium mengxianglii]|uniref:helix-turn-helix domain-containing protein n=1 Tax=Mycolicibacterium mengxianglii TaxID=2736649 RepID=UPI0018EEFB41|nr:helix-turn-helix domain-containing protein [Mycolicibacterium mengxianglii]
MRLSNSEIEEALFCVNEVIGWRQRFHQPAPSWMVQLARRFNTASLMSDTGHETGCDEPELESEFLLIGSTEAAEILGLTTRHLGRLARDLDGEKISNRWLFNRNTVIEYAKEKHRG